MITDMDKSGKVDLCKSSQERQRLLDDYETLILKASRQQRHDNWSMLEKPTYRLICTAPIAILQFCYAVVDVMQCSAAKRPAWDPRSGSAALKVVEQFCLRLWDNPWKRELRNIKQYSGFYKGKIENQLEYGERLFEQIGYQCCPDKELKINTIAEEAVKKAAFDMFFGSVLLSYLGEIHDNVKHKGISILHIWNARSSCHGTPEQISAWILANIDSPQKNPKSVFPHSEHVYEKPNMDERIHESKTNTNSIIKTSSFSSESVDTIASEKSFNDQFLGGNKHKANTVNGSVYNIATNSKELAQNDAIAGSPARHRTERKDSPVHKELQNLHALYKPATQDQHVEMSLQALQQQEAVKTNIPSWLSETDNSHEQKDWTFVDKISESAGDIPNKTDNEDTFVELGVKHKQKPSIVKHQHSLPLVFDSMHYATEESLQKVSPAEDVHLPQRSRCMPYGEPHLSEIAMQNLIVADGADEVDGPAAPLQQNLVFSTFGKASPQQIPTDINLDSTWPPADGTELYRQDESFPPPPPELMNSPLEGEDSVSVLLKDTQHHIDETLHRRIDHIDRRKAFSPELEAMLSRTPVCHSLVTGELQHDGLFPSFTSLPPSRNVTSSRRYHGTAENSDTGSENSDAHPPKDFWQCSSCTYRNKSDAEICEMCNKSKIVIPEKDPLQSGDIQCGHCTLINAADAITCAACRHSLKRSATYI